MIVLTPNAQELDDDQDLSLVAITTQHHDSLQEHQVALQWSKGNFCVTGLTAPSVAVCTWVVTVKASAIRKIGGIVPPHYLEKIIAKVSERGLM